MKRIIILIICFFICGCTNKAFKEVVIHENNTSKIKLTMVGDALVHKPIINYAYNGKEYNFKSIFSDLNLEGDLLYYNEESINGGEDLGYSGYPNFNTPDEFEEEMISLGFNLVSRGNNHTLDKGSKGIYHSSVFWKNHPWVLTNGSAYYRKDSFPEIREINGITYTLLSYTTLTNGYKSPNDYFVNIYSEEKFLNDIKYLNNKCDLVIVAIHFGEEYRSIPTESQRNIATFLAEHGANIIIGTHPHVIEPVEWIGNSFVMYSLGNFISSQSKTNEYERLIGMALSIDVIKTNNKIILSNPVSNLIYTYYNNYSNYKLIPFDKLNDNILYKYNYYHDKYNNIIKTYTNNITTN